MTRYEKKNHPGPWKVIDILFVLIISACGRTDWLFGCLISNVNRFVEMEYVKDHSNSLTFICDRERMKSANVMTDKKPQTGREALRSPLRFCFATNDSELHRYCVFHFSPSTLEHTQICWHGLNRLNSQLRIKVNSLLRAIICKISRASFLPW